MEKAQSASSTDADFALQLYQRISADEGANIFISPYSISTALAMVLLGSKENTAQELKASLQASFLDDGDIHFDKMTTLQKLLDVNDVQLDTASKLFPEKSFPVKKQYFDDCQKYYKAATESLDYQKNAEESRNVINKWVEEQTKGKITELLPRGSITRLSVLVLANAIYFKGNWLDEFKEAATIGKDFFVSEAETKTAQMMRQKQKYNFASDDELDVQVVEIPYKNEDFSMLILLPNQKFGIAALEKSLSASKLKKLISDMFMTDVQLALPRMKLEFSIDLVPHLKSMGVNDLFDYKKANLKGLSEAEELFVSGVYHKAVIEVNEKGSEAAAATGLLVAMNCLPLPPKELICDHPFMFIIRHIPTSSVLFLGRCTSP